MNIFEGFVENRMGHALGSAHMQVPCTSGGPIMTAIWIGSIPVFIAATGTELAPTVWRYEHNCKSKPIPQSEDFVCFRYPRFIEQKVLKFQVRGQS
jgi:hypothetical protein